MRTTLIGLVIYFASIPAVAFTVEPAVSMPISNSYSVSNIDAEYDLSGALFRLESTFDFGDALYSMDDRYFWGLGFGYGSFQGDLEDPSMASSSLSASATFNTHIPYFSIGADFSGFTIKLMASPYVWIKEAEGVTDGDEKYGYGGGIEAGYKVLSYLSVNVGYHYYMFGNGKNASTGQSGSLSNDVKMNFITAGISFPINFSAMSDFSAAPSRGSRRTRSGVR